MILDGDRHKHEVTLLNEKIRSLEEDIRIKVEDWDRCQIDINSLRQINSTLEIQISTLQSELSDSSIYKDRFEAKSQEYDALMK